MSRFGVLSSNFAAHFVPAQSCAAVEAQKGRLSRVLKNRDRIPR
jgi:hypothetical protein